MLLGLGSFIALAVWALVGGGLFTGVVVLLVAGLTLAVGLFAGIDEVRNDKNSSQRNLTNYSNVISQLTERIAERDRAINANREGEPLPHPQHKAPIGSNDIAVQQNTSSQYLSNSPLRHPERSEGSPVGWPV